MNNARNTFARTILAIVALSIPLYFAARIAILAHAFD
tara:strand:+ start:467 stop:577 length:111 start_codon:yes stop_codon:yes gene_type:complete